MKHEEKSAALISASVAALKALESAPLPTTKEELAKGLAAFDHHVIALREAQEAAFLDDPETAGYLENADGGIGDWYEKWFDPAMEALKEQGKLPATITFEVFGKSHVESDFCFVSSEDILAAWRD